MPETMTPATQAIVRSLGLIPMLGLAETIGAIASLGGAEPATDTVLHTPGRVAASSTSTLDEARSKELINDAGIEIPKGSTTRDPLQAAVSYPVTVKVLGIDHKLNVGGVAVGVRDETALWEAVARMPQADSYLVEETVGGSIAEMLVSIRAVENLGWMLTIGSGGSLVESLGDRVHRLTPVSRPEIETLIAELVTPTDPVVDVVMTLQELVEDDERILEVEINPLILTETTAVAVDAMVTLQ
jgi:succinyl-CoA synthetase beta subunit